jgi:agmatine deiminase
VIDSTENKASLNMASTEKTITQTIRVPAEWETQATVWLCWPSHEEHWGERLPQIRTFFCGLIEHILAFQPVRLVVQPNTEGDPRWAEFDHPEHLTIVELEHNDIWIRDYGPFFTKTSDGPLAVRQFQFNAWGEKFPPWNLDADFSRGCAEQVGWDFKRSPLILEGGAMEFNGAGIALTTQPCLLGEKRNSGSVDTVTDEIVKHLNLTDIIVLPDGLAGDHTDGHVDNMVRFVSERKVVMPNPNTPSINSELLKSVESQLLAWRHPNEDWGLKVDFLPAMEPVKLGD